MRTPSENFTNLMIGFEAEKLVGYKDSAGLPTIGIGHLIKKGEPYAVGKSITKEESRRLFAEDSKFAVDAVNKFVTRPISQNQFDALCSLVFNIGANAFRNSTVLRETNAGNFKAAAAAFVLWNKETKDGRKVVSRGLTNRRNKEAELFQKN